MSGYIVMFDLIDGLSNIDVCVMMGSIFGVYVLGACEIKDTDSAEETLVNCLMNLL